MRSDSFTYPRENEPISAANDPLPLSVVFPFFGRYERVEEGIFHRLEEMEPFGREFQFVFVLDGPFWKTLCLVQTLWERFPQAACVEIDHPTELPAVLFNAGMRASRGQAVAFALANQPWIVANYRRLAKAVRTGELGQTYYLSTPEMRARFSSLPTAALLHGWQQYGPLLPLTAVAAAPRNGNLFDESPLLQTACDWDWFVRLSKAEQVRHAGEIVGTASAAALRQYPFGRLFRPSDDLQHRYVLRSKQPIVSRTLRVPASDGTRSVPDTLPWCQESFLADLKPDDADYLQRRAEAFGSTCGPSASMPDESFNPDGAPAQRVAATVESRNLRRRWLRVKRLAPMHVGTPNVRAPDYAPAYKVAITGGEWEYHHNRGAFFNYFDLLQGAGFATYKVLLDRSVATFDLAGNDLVILTRARCDRVRFIVDQCAAMGIPTLYMIDDNFLTTAADFPQHYANQFAPGKPDYENILYALRNSTAVLTYSPILAEDIAPYARRVVRIPVSVPLADFESVPRPPHPGHFVVGYAGSLRHESAAFAAMADVARRRQDVRLLLFGFLSPEQEQIFHGLQPVRLPPATYDAYVQQIRGAAPDILLAPLGKTRTEQSKCPNKYLEITAAGAVGIYSAAEPYLAAVEHNRNGILVQGAESVADWRQAIEGLLDRAKLDTLWQAAREDVARKHDVPVGAEAFRTMVVDLLKQAKG